MAALAPMGPPRSLTPIRQTRGEEAIEGRHVELAKPVDRLRAGWIVETGGDRGLEWRISRMRIAPCDVGPTLHENSHAAPDAHAIFKERRRPCETEARREIAFAMCLEQFRDDPTEALAICC